MKEILEAGGASFLLPAVLFVLVLSAVKVCLAFMAGAVSTGASSWNYGTRLAVQTTCGWKFP